MKVAQFWFFKPRPLIWIVEILFQVFPLFKAPFKHHPFFRKKHVHLFFFKDVHRCINLCLAHFLWACTLSMAHIIKVACPHTRPWSVQKAGWALMCPAQSTHLLPFFLMKHLFFSFSSSSPSFLFYPSRPRRFLLFQKSLTSSPQAVAVTLVLLLRNQLIDTPSSFV